MKTSIFICHVFSFIPFVHDFSKMKSRKCHILSDPKKIIWSIKFFKNILRGFENIFHDRILNIIINEVY